MNNLAIFNYHDNAVRTITDENGSPWFVAKDVASTLGYINTRDAIITHCKKAVSAKESGITTLHPQTQLIPEPDIYRLVTHSKLPAAEEFEAWIFEEVLPTIRKTGGYITAGEDDTNEEIMAKAFLIAQDTIKRQSERNKALELENEAMKPKALFADAVAGSDTSILIGSLAKLIKQNGVDIGQNRLFKWLRDSKYLSSRKGLDFNNPTQYGMDRKLFELKERSIMNPDGSVRVTKTTMVTGKGQAFFINLFLDESGEDEAM